MTLTEFLAANPGAQTEVDAVKAEGHKAGRAEMETELRAEMAVIAPHLQSDKVAIRGLCSQVMAGTAKVGDLISAATVIAATEEGNASAAAGDETDALADTGGGDAGGAGPKEVLTSVDDLKAEGQLMGAAADASRKGGTE